MVPAMTEQRQFPRIDDATRLRWRPAPADSPFEQGLQINISGGGVCFTSEAALDVGAMLALELEPSGIPMGVLALGRVVWCRASERGHDVGVEFHWVGWDSSGAQQQIADYVKSRLK